LLPPEHAIDPCGRVEQDRARMEALAEKARAGTLTTEEQVELDAYERVGHFLSLLKSKARISLSQSRRTE
jgi:hypothetical protein